MTGRTWQTPANARLMDSVDYINTTKMKVQDDQGALELWRMLTIIRRISVTYTALIWVGISLTIFGAIVAALGYGGQPFFEATLGDFKVKTNQTGLAIMIAGMALAATIALRLPRGIVIMALEKKSVTEKTAEKLPYAAALVGVVAAILLVTSLL